MGNCQGASSGSMTKPGGRLKVTSYTFVNQQFIDCLQFGDLIEFNRGAYSHWGMYYDNGNVVHLHIAEGHEMEAITGGESFVPATVKCEPVGSVAGMSLVRINNKPKYKRQQLRPHDDAMTIMKLLLNPPEEHAYSYCLLYFNCEHFATFLKFEGISRSDQIVGWNRGHQFLTVCQKEERKQQDVRIFNTLAYLQWLENVRAARESRTPRKVLEEGIEEMDLCRKVVKETRAKAPMWRRLSVDAVRRKVDYEGVIQTLPPGETAPVLSSPEFREYKQKK